MTSHAPSPLASMLVNISRKSLLGRGPVKKLTAGMLEKLSTGALDLELWGGTARLHLDNGNEIKAALQPQRYDPSELELLSSAMTEPGSVFVDAGANAGLYSLHVALHCRAPATIVAVEPNASMLERVHTNLIELNPDLKARGIDFHLIQSALGDQLGTAFLDTGNTDPGHAQIVDNRANTQEVPIQPLHHLMQTQELARFDALKIDIEGYEDRVLFPFFDEAPASLYPKVVVIEANVDAWQSDCLQLLHSKNYVEVGKTRNNHLLRYKST